MSLNLDTLPSSTSSSSSSSSGDAPSPKSVATNLRVAIEVDADGADEKPSRSRSNSKRKVSEEKEERRRSSRSRSPTRERDSKRSRSRDSARPHNIVRAKPHKDTSGKSRMATLLLCRSCTSMFCGDTNPLCTHARFFQARQRLDRLTSSRSVDSKHRRGRLIDDLAEAFNAVGIRCSAKDERGLLALVDEQCKCVFEERRDVTPREMRKLMDDYSRPLHADCHALPKQWLSKEFAKTIYPGISPAL